MGQYVHYDWKSYDRTFQLSVFRGWLLHPAKAVGRNMPFGRDTREVPGNIVLDRGPVPHRKGRFGGSEPQFAAMLHFRNEQQACMTDSRTSIHDTVRCLDYCTNILRHFTPWQSRYRTVNVCHWNRLKTDCNNWAKYFRSSDFFAMSRCAFSAQNLSEVCSGLHSSCSDFSSNRYSPNELYIVRAYQQQRNHSYIFCWSFLNFYYFVYCKSV